MRRLRLIAPIAAVLLASAATTAVGSSEPEPESVSIQCGGYSADGELKNPEAAAITTAPVGADGRVAIPAICGGYTEDGVYVGDD